MSEPSRRLPDTAYVVFGVIGTLAWVFAALMGSAEDSVWWTGVTWIMAVITGGMTLNAFLKVLRSRHGDRG